MRHMLLACPLLFFHLWPSPLFPFTSCIAMTLLLRSLFGLAALALPFLFLLLVAVVYS